MESVYFLEGKPIKPIILKQPPKRKIPKKFKICPSCGQPKNRRFWKLWLCGCQESDKRAEAIRAKRRAAYYARERTSEKPIRENRK